MSERFLPPGLSGPDFYVAAIGRSGSTMLCNWLAQPPNQLVFIEPFFTRTHNPRLLRIQLADFGLAVEEQEWSLDDATAAKRFRRIMAPRLRGRSWAFKEVLCEEHFKVIDIFSPPRVVIGVRNIEDVALSFFEKHRFQNNLERFDDGWVRQYCLRESAGMLEFWHLVGERGIASRVVRYEDFSRSMDARQAVADFVGWEPGGTVDRHLAQFDRAFEVERHGRAISGNLRTSAERRVSREQLDAAASIASHCGAYQIGRAHV